MKPLIRKKILMGCEDDGTADSPYLTRWTLDLWDRAAIYLHVFHRSDRTEMHDHPWPFVSIILWRGYVEVTPELFKSCFTSVADGETMLASGEGWTYGGYGIGDTMSVHRFVGENRRRVYPGTVLFRRASHVHRVELVDGKKAVTLVIRGSRVRDWGFWTSNGWQRWKEYFRERGC